jgi:hypothetical protein
VDSTITVLGNGGFTTTCMASDLSSAGMRLVLCDPVAPGSAVKIETENAVVFGEIVYCQPAQPVGYAVGFKVDQVLRNLKLLQDLNRRLLGYEPWKQPELAQCPCAARSASKLTGGL